MVQLQSGSQGHGSHDLPESGFRQLELPPLAPHSHSGSQGQGIHESPEFGSQFGSQGHGKHESPEFGSQFGSQGHGIHEPSEVFGSQFGSQDAHQRRRWLGALLSEQHDPSWSHGMHESGS